MWKQFISDYLSFTKRERTGIWVLLTLLFLIILLPFVFPYFIKQKTYDHLVFEKAIADLKIKQEEPLNRFDKGEFDNRLGKNEDKKTGRFYTGNTTKGELFYFDPNVASRSDWERLGVRDKTITTIQNYLSKGGKFYKKEDIGKIWGFHQEEVKRLMPYIQIASTNQVNNSKDNLYEKKPFKKEITTKVLDINTADSISLITLPGIGSKLSRRIINFRDKLGGFYKVEQIGETFGLTDSTFQKIRDYIEINTLEIRKININTATVEEMKLHPYIRFSIANAIVQYRAQHGNFENVTDIKKIMIISEDVFEKVIPYLTTN